MNERELTTVRFPTTTRNSVSQAAVSPTLNPRASSRFVRRVAARAGEKPVRFDLLSRSRTKNLCGQALSAPVPPGACASESAAKRHVNALHA